MTTNKTNSTIKEQKHQYNELQSDFCAAANSLITIAESLTVAARTLFAEVKGARDYRDNGRPVSTKDFEKLRDLANEGLKLTNMHAELLKRFSTRADILRALCDNARSAGENESGTL